MLFEYLKENPALTAVLAICLVVILAVTAILITRHVKAGKAKTADAPRSSLPTASTAVSSEPNGCDHEKHETTPPDKRTETLSEEAKTVEN